MIHFSLFENHFFSISANPCYGYLQGFLSLCYSFLIPEDDPINMFRSRASSFVGLLIQPSHSVFNPMKRDFGFWMASE